MLIKDLQKLGLSENEARIYLAILELQNASTVDIAKKIKIPKSTIDSTLPKLTQKGLVKAYLKKSRKRYTAVDPKILKKNTEEQLKTAQSVMPQLSALFGESEERPVVEFYEGEHGLKIVLNTILDEAKELKGWSDPNKLFSILPEYFPTFPEERARRGIRLEVIFPDSPFARERHETDKEMLRTSKLIKGNLTFDSMILFWNDKTAIINHKKNVSVLVIQNQGTTDTLSNIFNVMWNSFPED